MNAFRATLLASLFVAVASAGAQDLASPLSDSLWTNFTVQGAASKAHRALGYITPTLGLATYLSMKGGDETKAPPGHKVLGLASGWAAGATVATGLVAHWDKLSFSSEPAQLFTLNNFHALVAGTGAVCMVTAAVLGGRDRHAFFGEAGTFLMGSAILLEW